MEQVQQVKPSIFQCRTCSNTVEVAKRTKRSDKPADQQVIVTLKPAKESNQDSKWTIKLSQGKQVSFGAKGYSDYSINQSDDRKQLYINRHKAREEQYWSHEADNLKTSAYWSRYLLWEFKDIIEAIKFIESKQNIKIKYTPNTVAKHQRKLIKSVKKMNIDADSVQ